MFTTEKCVVDLKRNYLRDIKHTERRTLHDSALYTFTSDIDSEIDAQAQFLNVLPDVQFLLETLEYVNLSFNSFQVNQFDELSCISVRWLCESFLYVSSIYIYNLRSLGCSKHVIKSRIWDSFLTRVINYRHVDNLA